MTWFWMLASQLSKIKIVCVPNKMINIYRSQSFRVTCKSLEPPKLKIFEYEALSCELKFNKDINIQQNVQPWHIKKSNNK